MIRTFLSLKGTTNLIMSLLNQQLCSSALIYVNSTIGFCLKKVLLYIKTDKNQYDCHVITFEFTEWV